jgi:DNA repair protein RecO
MMTSSAIILRTKPLRESDLWVRFATPQGRVTAIANSALKSRKRFPCGFPIGSVATIQFQPSKSGDLIILNEMTIQQSMVERDRIDHKTLGAMGIALELVDRTWPEHQESPQKFECLKRFLKTMNEDVSPAEPLLTFCWEWLDCLGFLPMMTACTRCDAHYDPQGEWVVIPDAGGVVCPACRRAGELGIAKSEFWKRDIIHAWITTILDLRLQSESWWKLLWNSPHH